MADAKSLVVKRQAVHGGYSPLSVDDVQVKEMALFAAQTLSSSLNGGKPLTVVKITKAESQLVAGRNFKLELTMGTGNSTISCEVIIKFTQ